MFCFKGPLFACCYVMAVFYKDLLEHDRHATSSSCTIYNQSLCGEMKLFIGGHLCHKIPAPLWLMSLVRPSSKSLKGMRASCTCQNMHFSYNARGEYRGLHAVPHQWERPLGMHLHVWSNIRRSFNQPPPSEDRQQISEPGPRVTSDSRSSESLIRQPIWGPGSGTSAFAIVCQAVLFRSTRRWVESSTQTDALCSPQRFDPRLAFYSGFIHMSGI